MPRKRRRQNCKNVEARFGHIDALRNEEQDSQCGKGSITWGPMVKVLFAWGILSVFVSGFVKAVAIGFPWAWVQVSLANLSPLVPNLGVVAFLVLLFTPFLASRYIPLGCFKGHAKGNALIVLLMFAAVLVPLVTVLLVVCVAFQMGQWKIASTLAAFLVATAALILVAIFSVKRISEDLPDSKDGMRRESAGDLIRGLLIISLGCCSAFSGAFLLSFIFDDASADVLLFVSSFVVAFVVLAIVIFGNPEEAKNCMIRAASAITPYGFTEGKRIVASLALGTIFVVILSAYIGCAGLMNEYGIQSIDEERPRAYRVVAELGGGRCVAIPIKEENGEWVDSGSIASLNVFDGYQIIEEDD